MFGPIFCGLFNRRAGLDSGYDPRPKRILDCVFIPIPADVDSVDVYVASVVV